MQEGNSARPRARTISHNMLTSKDVAELPNVDRAAGSAKNILGTED